MDEVDKRVAYIRSFMINCCEELSSPSVYSIFKIAFISL